jgi:hypothetical protein
MRYYRRMRIGPAQINYDLDLIEEESSIWSHEQCMRDFTREVRDTGIEVEYRRIDDLFLIYICSHVIGIKFDGPDYLICSIKFGKDLFG